jgi:hypothetical protein
MALACARTSPSTPAGTEPPAPSPTASDSAPRGQPRGGTDGRAARTPADSDDARNYEGVDPRGIPHYATSLRLSREDADVLRRAYGIDDPHRLYVSDSTEEGLLKYDTQFKRCGGCYVNSYRVGYVSVRRPDETWDEARASGGAHTAPGIPWW